MKKEYQLIFGRHTCLAILESKNREVYEIVISKEKSEEYKKIIDKKYSNLIKIYSNNELDKICKIEDKHQGIAVKTSSYIFKYKIEDIIQEAKDAENYCILAMDEINDPNNFGAIIRNAYGFEINAIIITKRNSCPITNAVVRSSVGYSEFIKIIEVPNLQTAIIKLKEENIWTFSLDSHATNLKLPELFKKYNKSLFVLGSEGQGIRDSIKKLTDIKVKINTNPAIESLNVANTSAIICYEYFNSKNKS